MVAELADGVVVRMRESLPVAMGDEIPAATPGSGRTERTTSASMPRVKGAGTCSW